MKLQIILLFILLFVVIFLASIVFLFSRTTAGSFETKISYWLVLHRQSNREYLYFGFPGEENSSLLIKTFTVKTGMPGERPTPLPELAGRKYWKIISKMSTEDNPETAPYFLTLDIPVSTDPPYGPVPYLECNGQCNWELPGAFGLHGVNGDMSRLSSSNPGSSGCIRHSDEDIVYLYQLLELKNEGVRYYIKDI